MRLNSLVPWSLALLAISVLSVGCVDPETPAGSKTEAAGHDHDDHGHDHGDEEGHDHGDHDHADHPAHGPNGGHLVDLDAEGVQLEWRKYPDNTVIRMYLLEADGKTAKSMKVDQFVVRPMVGNDDTEFVLEAEDANDEGLASTFMLDDQNLSIAMPLGVEIVVVAGDQTLNGKIEAHEPLDH